MKRLSLLSCLICLLIPGSAALSQPYPSFMLDTTVTHVPGSENVSPPRVAFGPDVGLVVWRSEVWVRGALVGLNGAPLDSLRIGRTGWVIALLASDGYVALFSAAELEPKIGPTRAFVAYAREGAALTGREGPFHVIVPTDGHGTRNARMVTTLRVIDALRAPQR